MRIRPIHDKVLIEMDPFDDGFGDSGIVRPQIARDKPMMGTVIGAGPGLWTRYGFLRTTLRPGDRVLVPWVRGHDLVIDGRFCIMISEFASDDVIALEAA
jgi:co-chaperonin GroES (HSP10)